MAQCSMHCPHQRAETGLIDEVTGLLVIRVCPDCYGYALHHIPTGRCITGCLLATAKQYWAKVTEESWPDDAGEEAI